MNKSPFHYHFEPSDVSWIAEQGTMFVAVQLDGQTYNIAYKPSVEHSSGPFITFLAHQIELAKAGKPFRSWALDHHGIPREFEGNASESDNQ